MNVERMMIQGLSRYMQYSLQPFGREIEASNVGPSLPLFGEYRRLNRPIGGVLGASVIHEHRNRS